MTISKPSYGSTGWNTATDAVIDVINAITPNGLNSDIQETARDAIGAALIAGSGITITVNDGADTITVSYSGNTVYTQAQIEEFARDAVGTALVAGTNISIVVDDAGNTITINNTGGGGGGYTQAQIEEFARDAVGAALVAGTNVDIAVNDGADTITIGSVALPSPVSATGGGSNVFNAGTGTAGAWFDLSTNPANVSITNPHSTKAMYVLITVGAWLITATSGVDVRLGFRTTGDIVAASGPGLSNVSPPSWGHVPLNANPSASVSFAASYLGIIPAAGTVNFISQSFFSSTTGTKQCNYPGIQIIPLYFA